MAPALSRGLRTEAVTAGASPCGPADQGRSAGAGGAALLRDSGGRLRISSPRTGIYSIPLDVPADTKCPAAIALSSDGQWLAWTADPKGILLFDLKKSSTPVAVLGEATPWRAVGFASNPDRIVAVDAADRHRAWSYFGSAKQLAKFARDSLPLENATLAEFELGHTPAKPLPVSLTIEECTRLLGVLPWITAPAQRDFLTDKCRGVLPSDDAT
jgi:hypothetical protein